MASKPYLVRELPFVRGSKRRTLERFTHLHEAVALAREVSAQQRLVEIELDHVSIDLWLNGQRQRPTDQQALPTPPGRIERP